MQTIVVTRTIPAAPEKVFDILADHANYKSFPGVVDSKLIKEGKADRNGFGAVREIRVKQGWFREEITAYERPKRFDYQIVATSLPIEHRGGSVVLEPVAGGTKVTWSTTLRVKIPLIGDLLTPVATAPLKKAFGAMLAETQRRLGA